MPAEQARTGNDGQMSTGTGEHRLGCYVMVVEGRHLQSLSEAHPRTDARWLCMIQQQFRELHQE